MGFGFFSSDNSHTDTACPDQVHRVCVFPLALLFSLSILRLLLVHSSCTYWTVYHEVPVISVSSLFFCSTWSTDSSFVLVSTELCSLPPSSLLLSAVAFYTQQHCLAFVSVLTCHHRRPHHLVPVSDDRPVVSHMVVSVVTFSLGSFQVCLMWSAHLPWSSVSFMVLYIYSIH